MSTSGGGEAGRDEAGCDETGAHNGAAGAGWTVELRLALGFLTILPVIPTPAAPEAVAASFGWFPLVGFAIGAVLCLENLLLGFFFGPALQSILLVMSLALLTGAVHLDGLADTADALGAGRDRPRALEILRDSRIGGFGAVALFFVLALKIAALASLGATLRYAALYLALGLARWAMVTVTYGLEYLRPRGAGTTLLARGGARNRFWANLTAVIASAPLIPLHALKACLAAAIVTMLLRAFYRRWIGGVTGDLIGAAAEIVETAVLLAIAS